MASHYRDAAKCLKAVDGGRTTLKTAAYKTQNPPRTVALVSEVRRHRKALETAIAATGLREKAGGDALAVGARYAGPGGRSDAGKAYVYLQNGATGKWALAATAFSRPPACPLCNKEI